MTTVERKDDFNVRRRHLQKLSDKQLHVRFWALVDALVQPLVVEARTHTTPSIERSVLLRMGFSSVEAKALVERAQELELLGRGVGRLVLELAKAKRITVPDAGALLLDGHHWDELTP
ncbi:MAG: ornithine aminomutase subunit alpha [Gammaproteobacteria bacterium]|nr:ornithine aminomutase subunit alpha [Gammaproteobacteria bacterium]